MRSRRTLSFAAALFLVSTLPILGMPRAHRGPTASFFNKRTSKPASVKPAAQRSIAPERATQIQSALIKSGYLTAPASGTWDTTTEAAMQKFQADNGWQTKLIPDSRAIIRLGLGSSNEPVSASVQRPDGSAGIPEPNSKSALDR